MTLTELKATLADDPSRLIRIELPDHRFIPAHFHVTEVGHVRKDFVDCGGTVRRTSACVLQAWVPANDRLHRLAAGKLAHILTLAEPLTAGDDLPVEVEFDAPYASRFPVAAARNEGDAVIFSLASTHTDCLAKESCGVEAAPACIPGGACCTPAGDCC